MVIPPGFDNNHSSHSCKLWKSFYDLKQASRVSYEEISLLILSCGYKQANFDHSLFVKHKDKKSNCSYCLCGRHCFD